MTFPLRFLRTPGFVIALLPCCMYAQSCTKRWGYVLLCQIEECEETRLAHIGQRAVLAQQLVTTQVFWSLRLSTVPLSSSQKVLKIISSLSDWGERPGWLWLVPLELLRYKARKRHKYSNNQWRFHRLWWCCIRSTWFGTPWSCALQGTFSI